MPLNVFCKKALERLPLHGSGVVQAYYRGRVIVHTVSAINKICEDQKIWVRRQLHLNGMVNKESKNRLIMIPAAHVRGFGGNLVVTPTNHYCKLRTPGGLLLPEGQDDHHEKKYDIGEVVAVGPDVPDISPGDVVLWQCTSAWRLPNGIDDTLLYHVPKTAVVAVLPNPATLSEEDQLKYHETHA